MFNFQQYLGDHIYDLAISTLSALAVLLLAFLFYRTTKKPLITILKHHKVDTYLIDICVYSVYRTVIVLIALITALAQMGVNVLAAMTGFGVVGLAIGFAAKDSLGNFIAGFMILWDKPFLVGDWVEVDGQFGQVQAITLRSTRIHTTSNFHVVIPNQNIINNTVINHHHAKPVRTTTHFYLPYDCDIEKALDILITSTQTVELVMTDPAPSGGLTAIESGLVKIAILVWTANAEDSIGIDTSIRHKGVDALKKAGFEAPYPITLSAKPTSTKRRTTPRKS